MPWSVLRVLSGLDAGKRVERSLDRLQYEYYNPLTYQDWRRGNYDPIYTKKQNTVRRKVQLFPGYIFLFIVDQWRALLRETAIIDFIRDSDGPIEVKPEIVDQLKSHEVDGVILPNVTPAKFYPQQQVKICDPESVFCDRIAIFDGMTGPERCAVLLELLGKQTRKIIHESLLEAV